MRGPLGDRQNSPGPGGSGNGSTVPDATVARLPLYLRSLRSLLSRRIGTVSSDELARSSGVNPAKLRKDLSFLGGYGTRGVGYDVIHLAQAIEIELGQLRDWPVAIVGIGNLGHALANFDGFTTRGFRVAALLDVDPGVCGTRVAGLRIVHMDELDSIIAENEINIAVMAVPPSAAQGVVDRLVDAGITSILSFATTSVTVPNDVSLRQVDLSVELQILAFHELRKSVANQAEERATGQPSMEADSPKHQ